MNRLIAVVAVENTFFNYDSDYDYYVPESSENLIRVGCRVKVPFGRGNKIRNGIVIKLYSAINSDLKEIKSIIDTAVLSEEMISLAIWLKERCFCTTYYCLILMLPRGIDKIGYKSYKMIRLKIFDDRDFPRLTVKQNSVCTLLFDVGTASVAEVCEFCSVGKTVLNNLVKNGVCEYYQKEVYRMPYKNVSDNGVREDINLSDKQFKAFEVYRKMLNSDGGTGLLFGVTGSGKTQVYLRLIDEALDNNKDVIIMVPEIALTPQMLGIFYKRYGRQVAVFHSALSLGERNDEYKRVDRGEAKIVLGTRSAVFAPVHNLGLIIMDEEQEYTYKSDRTPKYHAREVANFRCRYNKALFLMTSATPSVESYSNALNGKYVLCELD